MFNDTSSLLKPLPVSDTQQMQCKKSNNIIKTLSMTENMHEWQLKELKGIAKLPGVASVCIQCVHWIPSKSQFWLNFNVFWKSHLWRDINHAILLFFFCKKYHFLGYKCVSIHNLAWILSRAQLLHSGRLMHTHHQRAGGAAVQQLSARKYSNWALNTYTFIAQKWRNCFINVLPKVRFTKNIENIGFYRQN